MRELEHELGDRLAVVGVHSPKFPAERETANLRHAVLRLGVDHPVVNDADQAIWGAYAVRAWPTLMVVGPTGTVIGRHEGEFAYEPMRDFLRDLLNQLASADALLDGPLPLRPETEPDTGPLRYPGKVVLAHGDSPDAPSMDASGGRLFIADSGHDQVVVATVEGRVLRRIGSGRRGFVDGAAEEAAFDDPQGLDLSPDGARLVVADRGNHAVRSIDLASGVVTTLAGTGARTVDRAGGPARETPLASPHDVVFDGEGRLWVAMAGTHQLWVYDEATDTITPRVGTGAESIHDGPLAEATFAQPSGITLGSDGLLYVADSETSAVRSVDVAGDRVRRLVGRGLFTFGDVDARADSVRLQHPIGINATVEDGRTVVYLADTYNDKVKRLDPATREVETVLGGGGHGHVDGPVEEAELWHPGGLAIAGRTLYVADTNTHRIRVADLDAGEVRTLELRED